MLNALFSINTYANAVEHQTRMRTFDIDVPALNAADALNMLAEQTDSVLLFPYRDARARRANAVRGRYTLMTALAELLRGSGLSGSLSKNGAIKISLVENTRLNHEREGRDNMKTQSKKTLLAGIAAFFTAAVTTSNIVAQETDVQGTSGGVLEEIIVTAQKRAQKLSDVPMSIAALSDAELDKRGIRNLVDLALSVPGLSVQDQGPYQRRIVLRGVGNVFGSSSLVGVYVDEMSVVANPLEQLDLRVHDLERVEVLRGPQGTLYGEGSTGGAIRFITKQPELDTFGANADISAAGIKDGDGQYDFRGVVNVPIIEDTLALRVAGTYAREGGWIEQPGRSLEDINDQEVVNLRLKALWRPVEALDITGSVTVHRNDAGASPAGEDTNGDFAMPFVGFGTSSFEDDYEIYNLTINYDLGAVELLSSSGYVATSKVIENASASFPPDPRFGLVFDSVSKSDTFAQEVRLSAAGDGPLNWTVGGFYKDIEIDIDNPQVFFGAVNQPPLGPFSTFSVIRTSESWALFGQASYLFAGRLEVGAGLRYFEDERSQLNRRTPGVPAQEDSFDALTPRVFARYDLTEDISLYANVAKGFRSGGFNTNPALPTFDPESLWSYEIGVKGAFWDRRVESELTLYYSDYTDMQSAGQVPTLIGGVTIPLNRTANIGEAEVRGIEALLRWQLDEQWSIGLQGTLTDTEVTKVDAVSSGKVVGDKLDLVPDYSFGAWAAYEFQWGAGIAGVARLDYNQQGETHYLLRDQGPFYFSDSDIIDMLDMKLAASRDNWRVELFARNLLNERGLIDPLEIEAAGVRARPRTVGVRVGLDF